MEDKSINDAKKEQPEDATREYVKPTIIYKGKLEAYATHCMQKAGACSAFST